MVEKKKQMDRMILNGFKLEMPYFWYLENCTIEELQELWQSQVLYK